MEGRGRIWRRGGMKKKMHTSYARFHGDAKLLPWNTGKTSVPGRCTGLREHITSSSYATTDQYLQGHRTGTEPREPRRPSFIETSSFFSIEYRISFPTSVPTRIPPAHASLYSTTQYPNCTQQHISACKK